MVSMTPRVEIATVLELYPNKLCRLQLPDETEIIGYMSGKIKRSRVSILVGDKVKVEIDPYGGKTTNRIIFRYK